MSAFATISIIQYFDRMISPLRQLWNNVYLKAIIVQFQLVAEKVRECENTPRLTLPYSRDFRFSSQVVPNFKRKTQSYWSAWKYWIQTQTSHVWHNGYYFCLVSLTKIQSIAKTKFPAYKKTRRGIYEGPKRVTLAFQWRTRVTSWAAESNRR